MTHEWRLVAQEALVVRETKSDCGCTVAGLTRESSGVEQPFLAGESLAPGEVLRVAASDITGQFPIAEVSNQLTYIAEVCVSYALDLAWRDLVAKYGTPRCADGAGTREVRVAVIGYGKLGGWELGYGSDLDLVFLHDSAGEAQRTDGERQIARVGDNRLTLTLTEIRLLRELAAMDLDVAARDALEACVFGGDGGKRRSLDVHICSLRKKLKAAGLMIESVRGVGYRLNPCRP